MEATAGDMNQIKNVLSIIWYIRRYWFENFGSKVS